MHARMAHAVIGSEASFLVIVAALSYETGLAMHRTLSNLVLEPGGAWFTVAIALHGAGLLALAVLVPRRVWFVVASLTAWLAMVPKDPPGAMTAAGIVHQVGAGVSFTAFAIGALRVSWPDRKRLGIAMVAAGCLLVFGLALALAQVWPAWFLVAGLAERATLAMNGAWILLTTWAAR